MQVHGVYLLERDSATAPLSEVVRRYQGPAVFGNPAVLVRLVNVVIDKGYARKPPYRGHAVPIGLLEVQNYSVDRHKHVH